MPNSNKRKFIKNIIAVFIASVPAYTAKMFAAWPNNLFNDQNSDSLVDALVSGNKIADSELITIKAPDIAENGGVVPITVSTELERVKNIAIIVDSNPNPLTSSFAINHRLSPYVSTRVKMAKTSNITAIVATEEGYYRAARNIKVTIGGCGG